MSRAVLWCDVHNIARQWRSDGKGTRCPACFAAQQERYRREVLGRKPFVPSQDATAQARKARYQAWRTVHARWTRFAALPVEVQREAIRGLR